MKVFTLNGYFNYGNRLQLFALAKVLNRMNRKKNYVFWPRSFSQKIKEFLKFNTRLFGDYRKEAKLKRFTKKNIGKNTGNPKCDYSIVGSDQVWNPDYLRTRPFLLNVPNNSIKIAYAASIGKEELNKDELDRFREALKDYKAISVRERSAKELLQPLTDKKVEVVLDPTLLLDKTEYEKLETKPDDIKENEKYVFCYILGGREQMDAIKEFADKKGYKVLLFSDKSGSSYGIEEFLYLIHHAELICTDSFHACVFSFIFEKPFVAFRRTGTADYMYTRLQNLIETFELKGREFNGKNITSENVKADYSEAKKILEKEQKKSMEFLKNALGVCDE